MWAGMRALPAVAEADPFSVYWSSMQTPEDLCVDLEDQKSQGPVKLRAVGQPQSKFLGSPAEAARWIRGELLEESTITIDNERRKLVICDAAASDSEVLLVDELPSHVLETWNKAHPERKARLGDQIVEVNGVRGDAKQLRREFRKRIRLELKVMRGRSHLLAALASVTPAPSNLEVSVLRSTTLDSSVLSWTTGLDCSGGSDRSWSSSSSLGTSVSPFKEDFSHASSPDHPLINASPPSSISQKGKSWVLRSRSASFNATDSQERTGSSSFRATGSQERRASPMRHTQSCFDL